MAHVFVGPLLFHRRGKLLPDGVQRLLGKGLGLPPAPKEGHDSQGQGGGLEGAGWASLQIGRHTAAGGMASGLIKGIGTSKGTTDHKH